MIFYARRGGPLTDIEAHLARSDPALAAQFERFNTQWRRSPVPQERQPSQPARRKKLIAILLVPVALLLLSWYAVTGSGRGSTRGCATTAIALCPSSQLIGREAHVAAHQEIGPRASDTHALPTAP